MMFARIFQFELAYWLRQPVIYIYGLTLLTLSTAAMAANLGLFDASTGMPKIGNTPLDIYQMITFFQDLLLFLLPAVMGYSIYRDFQSKMHRVLFVYPFTKGQYLAAKFLSSLLVVLALSTLVGIGIFVGTQLPGISRGATLPFNSAPYLHTYLWYIFPNLIGMGALVFVITGLSRNIYAGFISVILLVILQEILNRVLAGSETQALALILEPFGERGTAYYTRFWTAEERLSSPLPLESGIIFNRILWGTISIGMLIWGYLRFQLSEHALNWFRQKRPAAQKPIPEKVTPFQLPKVHFNFTNVHLLKAAWKLSNADFYAILHSGPFISIALAGLLFVIFSLLQMNPQFDTKILPVTWVMLKYPLLFFSLVIVGLTFLYAGILMQRARTVSMDQLVDTTPTPNWVLLFSKFLALVKMQMFLLSLIMLGGISVQVYKGYYHFEIGHYLFDLYGLHLIYFVLWAMVAILVQTIFTNAYLGLFTLLLMAGGISVLPDLGLKHPIFQFNQNPNPNWLYAYSDLDGYGPGITSYFAYKAYWLMGGLLCLSGALLFWIRGLPLTFRERLRVAKERLNRRAAFSLILLSISFLGLGFGLYHLSQDDISNEDKERWMAENERLYRQYHHMPQPRITAVDVQVDLSPETRTFEINGSYQLTNKSSDPIDTLLVHSHLNTNTEISLFPTHEVVLRDSIHRFEVIKLRQALLPGGSLTLYFKIKNQPSSWFDTYSIVNSNGTYFDNRIFPGLGYRAVELESEAQRKKYGLPLRAMSKPLPSDATAQRHSYSGDDADEVDFAAIISTTADQIAIAPGQLQREWTEGNRRYFYYQMPGKIKNYFGFNSGRYALYKDRWQDVDLEIYHHPDHDHNLEHMIKGLKGTLAYNTAHFSPYQHQQARIIEFARSVGSFATTFATCIPFSEIRFIADVEEGAIDFPFYMAAHEMAHQWWGNQLIPADALGAKMLTEGLAEYTTLRVLEKEYGKEQMRRFLQFDRELYLRGRGRESESEMPLIHTHAHQDYINYRKGALAFYTLSEHLGEAVFNDVLKAFLEEVQQGEGTYPTSVELVQHLRQATPDSLKYLITDWLETITLYDNQILDAQVSATAGGQYETTLHFLISKYHSGELGKRVYEDEQGDQVKSLPLQDYIEIGFFDTKQQLLHLEKAKITEIENKISVITNQRPSMINIDPFNKVIDANTADNWITVHQ